MKKPRLILHIGSHKTGTTGIQRFCSAKSGLLREQGIFYPSYSLIGEKDHYAHHAISHGFAGQDERWPLAKIERFLNAVAENCPEDATIVLSAEPFYRHVARIGQRKSNHLPDREYWEGKRLYIEGVARALENFEVEVVAVFRKQTDYFNSLYQEVVKVTGFSGSAFEFYLMKRNEFNYFAQIKHWAASFPNVRVLVFEDLLKSGNLLKCFLEEISGRPLSLPEISSKMNSSLHPLVIETKRRWNALQQLKNKEDRIELGVGTLKNLQKWGVAKKLILPKVPRSYLTAAEARFLSLSCRTSNKKLRSRYFPDGSTELEQYSPGGAWHEGFNIRETKAIGKMLAKLVKENRS